MFDRKKKTDSNIEDVYAGQLYREHFGIDGFFKGTSEQAKQKELHISLQVNTDGVSLFRSSSFSIWPLYFIVNELPPKCRYVYQIPVYDCLVCKAIQKIHVSECQPTQFLLLTPHFFETLQVL